MAKSLGERLPLVVRAPYSSYLLHAMHTHSTHLYVVSRPVWNPLAPNARDDTVPFFLLKRQSLFNYRPLQSSVSFGRHLSSCLINGYIFWVLHSALIDSCVLTSTWIYCVYIDAKRSNAAAQISMGTVDLDRYTGSCLITTAVRPRPKSQQAQCKTVQEAQLSTSAVATALPLDSTSSNKPTVMMTQDPRNWAGAPLLSMAASIRKTKQNPGISGNKSWHSHQHHHLHTPVYHHIPGGAILPHHPHPVEAYAAACHLQGAPLIRIPRQQQQQHFKQHPLPFQPNKRLGSLPVQQLLQQPQQQRPSGVRRPFALPIVPPPPTGLIVPARSTEDGRSAASSPSSTSSSSSGSISISDTCSITSDEGLASGGSESSLPRIIKSRRRHKKKKQQLQPQQKSTTTAMPSQQQLQSPECALAELDQLTELFRSCASLSTTLPSPSTQQPVPLCLTPPLWPQQGDIWSSPSCASTSSSPPSSSLSSCWPDQRVIRRPNRAFINSNALAPVSQSPEQQQSNSAQLHVSSQLIASPFNGHRDIEIRFFSSGNGGSGLADSNQLFPR